MDELLMVLPAGLVAVPIFALMQRAYRHLASAPLWAGAWCVLFVTALVGITDATDPAFEFVAEAGAALFAALLLAGALRFTRHRLAGRVFPAAWGWIVGAGVARAAAPEAGAVLGAVLSSAALACCAALVWKRARRVGAGHAEHTLAGAFLLIGFFELLGVVLPKQGPIADSFVPAWIALGCTTGAIQLVVFVERSHARERSLDQSRRVLARIAEVAAAGSGLGAALSELAGSLPGTGAAPFFGVWLREGQELRLFESSGTHPGWSTLIGRVPLRGNAYVEEVAQAPGPLMYDVSTATRGLRELMRNADVERAAATAIRSAEGELIGVLGAVLAPWAEHDEEISRFIRDLSQVIGRVLDNSRGREAAQRERLELASSRRSAAALVAAVPVGLLVTDREARVRLINGELKRQLDLDPFREWQGRTAEEVFAQVLPALDAPMRAAVEGFVLDSADQTRSFRPLELPSSGGGERVLRLSTTPVLGPSSVPASRGGRLGQVWVSQDVTSERHVTQRLLQADQLETLGTLAGGLAHDFNNQLTGILGNAHLLLADLPPRDDRREAVEDLQRSAELCADLTRRLLTFARPAVTEAGGSADLHLVLSEMQPLLRPMLPDKVSLEIDIDPATPRLLADPGELRRVLFNLIVNARDAVSGAGTIEVRARPLGPLGPIEIVVADDGIGVAPALQGRIFDPLFTTKEPSLGTGLGLAIVREVIEAHGAQIRLESEPGGGSVFTLDWPAAEMSQPLSAHAEVDPRGDGTVLIAEDEPGVRRMAQRALERVGYRVLVAGDGDEAWRRFLAHADEIDLLLFDLSMPGMDGLSALARVREERPGIPAIVMSGHPDQARARPWPADVPLLAKPFGPEMLLARVADTLGQEA